MIEKPIYPSKTMRITQEDNVGTHKDSFAIDEAGENQGISVLYSPFTGIIKKIYTKDANEIWIESINPVEYPDGTIDYMTIMMAHANSISNLYVGKKIKKGEPFYSEGTKGKATGNHCHIECARGKFYGTGWHKNRSGNYSINNGKKIDECLWIDKTINIINSKKYKFRLIPEEKAQENAILEEEKKNQLNQDTSENKPTNPIFICHKNDLYGIYLKAGEKLFIK